MTALRILREENGTWEVEEGGGRGERTHERKGEMDECWGLREGRMKKEKYQEEPRCVFFSDKGGTRKKKGRDEPIEKKEDHCEGKNVH